MSRTKRKIIKKVLVVVFGVAMLLGVAFAGYSVAFAHKIYLHQFAGSIDLGGKTELEAKKELVDASQKYLGQNLSLKNTKNGASFTFKPADVGVVFDANETVDQIWEFGRKSDPFADAWQQLQSLFSTRNTPLVYVLNDTNLDTKLKDLTKNIDYSAHDYEINYSNGAFILNTERKEGLRVDTAKLKRVLQEQIGNLSTQEIVFAPEYYKPTVSEARAKESLAEANQVLAVGALALHYPSQDFPFDNDTLGSFILSRPNGDNLELYFDEDRIKKVVATVAKSIDTEPQNAKLTVTNGTVTVFQVSAAGKKLDQDDAFAQITNTLLQREKGQSQIHSIDIKVAETKPEVSDNAAAELGLKELVGTATTDFKGSTANRVANITTGAKALNGALIKPGDEFSTLNRLGKIDGSTGYLQELVIKDNTTVPDYGGGLCQVSSTLFRATLNAGLKITERQNHSYRVSYYEPPVGMDATIFDPSPDFKFVNNYDSYLLIQSQISGTKITFDIYGTKDDRQISIGTPVVSDVVDPGPPIKVQTDTLPTGEEKRTDKAHPGATAKFDYNVTRAGQTLQQKTFVSKYVPWPERWLVGTAAPTCTDGVQNGDEAGVDCGGSCGNQCGG